MPFFDDPDEAKRYAQNRPFFHPIAVKRVKDVLGFETVFPLAVDIACGTGQSTVALAEIAEQVIGLDISWSMLAAAKQNAGRQYVQAQAESIPLQSGTVPFMSSALAFHWFDRDRFLGEARRVLRPAGLLLIYDNGFRGIMRENPSFVAWAQDLYAKRYPAPDRDRRPFNNEEAEQSGFAFIHEESYENDVRFTPENLVAYLTTQTNVVAALNQGRENQKSAEKWLLDQIRPFFADSDATFVFRTVAKYLQKQSVH